MERFVGILIEHFNGAFPLWMAPVQVTMVPIADRHNAYAEKIATELRALGMRVAVDSSSDRMNKKIRNAQLQKVPYMLVVGDNEQEAGQVAVRTRDGGDLGTQSVSAFKLSALEKISTYVREL
jgi:threonyl-tRNA synthetase